MTVTAVDIAQASEQVQGISLFQSAMRRLIANRAAMAGLIMLLLMGALALFSFVLGQDAIENTDISNISTPPDFSAGYYFGTDSNGRDLMARTFYGTRISLMIGLVASMVSLTIGVSYGAISGFMGGSIDNVMMRIVDILYSLPFIFFVILLTVYFGREIILMFVAIGAVEWLDMARIVRGQTMSLKHREFIEAANAFGVSNLNIVRRHIIPNTLGPVVVFLTLTVPRVILIESFLSFLGLGVQEPATSLGVLINEGAAKMESAPWALLFPATFLTIILFSFNFLGDGLRDALDPKDR